MIVALGKKTRQGINIVTKPNDAAIRAHCINSIIILTKVKIVVIGITNTSHQHQEYKDFESRSLMRFIYCKYFTHSIQRGSKKIY